jgi:hypothetical protein
VLLASNGDHVVPVLACFEAAGGAAQPPAVLPIHCRWGR